MLSILLGGTIKMNKTFLTIIGGIVIAGGILAACGEADISKVEDDETGEDVAEEAGEDATEEVTGDGAENEFAIGDTANFNDLQVTVNSVRQYSGDPEAWEEPENDHFLIYDVSIDNTGDEPANISSIMNFSVLDADGYAHEMSLFVTTKGSLDGEIGAGRTMAGEIAFDVEESEYFEFIFEDVFSSGQAIWTEEASNITE